jgi:hypothetical protein
MQRPNDLSGVNLLTGPYLATAVLRKAMKLGVNKSLGRFVRSTESVCVAGAIGLLRLGVDDGPPSYRNLQTGNF